MKDNRPPKEERTLKRGDVREDGMVFWAYAANAKNGEHWRKPEKFQSALKRSSDWDKENRERRAEFTRRYRSRHKVDNRPTLSERNLVFGQVRDDGMIFAGYHPDARNGEQWLSDSAFKKRKEYRRNLGNRRYKERVLTDSKFKITKTIRSRVCIALKNASKCSSTVELLGAPIDFVRKHLESNFKEGMTWDNHGTWHIDHIKPCASFDLTLDSEQRACFHYLNLQPLWAEDNLRKSDKYTTDRK